MNSASSIHTCVPPSPHQLFIDPRPEPPGLKKKRVFRRASDSLNLIGDDRNAYTSAPAHSPGVRNLHIYSFS